MKVNDWNVEDIFVFVAACWKLINQYFVNDMSLNSAEEPAWKGDFRN